MLDFAYTKDNRAYWKCECECKNIAIVSGKSLRGGYTKSCGCIHTEMMINNFRAKLEGLTFGLLTVLEYGYTKENKAYWKCECNCKNIVYASTSSLIMGKRKSCGCLSSNNSYSTIVIENLLKENNIPFSREYRFVNCRNYLPLPFDFSIFDEKGMLIRLVEYDGQQHFKAIDHWGGEESLERCQENDRIKNEYCLQNNIPLVHIPYTEKNITIEKILGDEYLI